MAKSRETYSKKEKEKKKLKKRQDKEEKREMRKSDNQKGQDFDSMLAYVDENGNLTSEPQDLQKKNSIPLESIVLGATVSIEPTEKVLHTGIVTFFNEQKGYGFVRDSETKESLFLHSKALLEMVRNQDKVNYFVEDSPRGPVAVEVRLSKQK
ncbi:MAG: cold shock domain-containing protein [Cytophagaceae bacterium]|jgi:cold shock CspA family protein|nr:cold shock domain-containing protein [Cytophagaceae bacterium]